jgi:16S rRNA G966 N2-methylase RsmD
MAAQPSRIYMHTGAVSKTPFYIEVTNVKEGKYDLPLLTLPPGTVLFRGVKIPNTAAGEDVRYFYRDYLGTPEDIQRGGRVVQKQVCLPPTHNVFFYPFPFVGFGIHTVGETFHSMQAVVLVHPMTVICNVSPSTMSRGDTHRMVAGNIYARCSQFNYDCHTPTARELEAKEYDNCLHPEYQQRSGTRGWMAIANLDSLFPKSDETKKLRSRSPMGKYIANLEQNFPGQGSEVLAWAYRDSNKHSGFPEIAIYPYQAHPGPQTITRTCGSEKEAISIMVFEASRNNLNYLPLAAFTKDGIVDMVNGQFDFKCIPADANTFGTNPHAYHSKIEEHMRNWMNHVETEGLRLPYYGKQKLMFDTRTGFFVFPQMLPRTLEIPVPKDPNPNYANDPSTVPYYHLLMPLETDLDRKRALEYMIVFRSFIKDKAFMRFGLDKGVGVRRAMVLSRPPFLPDLFKGLQLDFPDNYKQASARAVRQYKANTGEESKADKIRKAAQETALAVPMVYGFNITSKRNISQPPFHTSMVPDTFIVNDVNGKEVINTKMLDILEMGVKKEYNSLFETRKDELEEDKKSKTYMFGSAEEVAAAPEEVRVKLNYYFSNIDEEDRWMIALDDVALFSVTEPKIAEAQALQIRKVFYDMYGAARMQNAVITDATACIGGNTMAFAKYFFVNAVEMSPQRAYLLARNINAFNFENVTRVICSDYLHIMDTLKQDIVFFDPPWGGRDYKKHEKIDMFLGEVDIKSIAIRLLNTRKAAIVAIKAPLNYNVKGLEDSIEKSGKSHQIIVNTLTMPKMYLIILSLNVHGYGTYRIPGTEQYKPATPVGQEFAAKVQLAPQQIISYAPKSPPYNPRTPPYYQATYAPYNPELPPYNPQATYAPKSPPYNPESPPYNPQATYAPKSPPYNPESPPYNPQAGLYPPPGNNYSPKSPAYFPTEENKKSKGELVNSQGGYRKTRHVKKQKGRQTRRVKQDKYKYIRMFQDVWKAHARANS